MAGVLCTCPGKLGDLIYCQPAIIALGEHLGRPVSLLTSSYCRSALPLLALQPHLDSVAEDQNYGLKDFSLGCQPWRMSEPAGFERVFHLGLRPRWAGPGIFRRHLSRTFLRMVKLAYGLELAWEAGRPYLELAPEPISDRLVFQGLGKSFVAMAGAGLLDHLRSVWADLLTGAGLGVVALAGPGEEEAYDWLDCTVATPPDLLAAARLIKGARAFVGVESVGAALADGLKTPRLVLDWFGNGLPTGPRGASFRLDEPLSAARQRLAGLLAA